MFENSVLDCRLMQFTKEADIVDQLLSMVSKNNPESPYLPEEILFGDIYGLYLQNELIGYAIISDYLSPDVLGYMINKNNVNSKDALQIQYIWIHPNHRGNGYFHSFLDLLIDKANLSGKTVFIETHIKVFNRSKIETSYAKHDFHYGCSLIPQTIDDDDTINLILCRNQTFNEGETLVRPLTAEDIPALWDLQKMCRPEDIQDFGACEYCSEDPSLYNADKRPETTEGFEPVCILGLFVGDELVGYALQFTDEEESWLFSDINFPSKRSQIQKYDYLAHLVLSDSYNTKDHEALFIAYGLKTAAENNNLFAYVPFEEDRLEWYKEKFSLYPAPDDTALVSLSAKKRLSVYYRYTKK